MKHTNKTQYPTYFSSFVHVTLLKKAIIAMYGKFNANAFENVDLLVRLCIIYVNNLYVYKKFLNKLTSS